MEVHKNKPYDKCTNVAKQKKTVYLYLFKANLSQLNAIIAGI